MANPLRTLAKNTAAVFTTNVLDLSLGFLLLGIVSRYLGPVRCGNYFVIVAVAEILKIIADFGVEGIIIREVARDRAHAGTLMGAALALRWFIFGAAFLIELFVVISLGMPFSLIVALAVATISQFFASTAMLFISVYKGFEKMGYETLLAVVLRVLSVGLLCLVALYDLGLIAVFIAIAFSQLVRMVIGLAIIHGKFARVRLIFSARLWKKLLGASYPLGFSAFFLFVSFRIGVLVIKALGKLEDVSLFSLPHMVVLQLAVISSAVVVALFPVFSRLALSSSDALKVAFDKSFKLVFALGLILFMLIVKYAPLIVVAIGGAAFAPSGAALRVLGCTIPFLFLVHLLHFLLISADRQGYVLASFIICFSLNLCLDILVVPRWGYIGVSWAALVSYAVLFIVSFIFVWWKVIELDWVQLARPVIAAVPAGLLLLYSGNNVAWGAAAVAVFLVAASLLKVFTLDEVRLLGEALAHPSSKREGSGIL